MNNLVPLRCVPTPGGSFRGTSHHAEDKEYSSQASMDPPTTSVTATSALTTSRSWRMLIEPWFFAYGLLGAAIAGLAPIVLPIAVSLKGTVTEVGLVMGAFNMGGLVSPVWGYLVNRYRGHRRLMVLGFFITACALTLFPFSSTLIAWITLALLQGAGAAAVATVANLFIVETHPADEWDRRIGWLQTFYGAGQVGGLLLAGLLTRAGSTLGFLVASGLTAIAFLGGWFTSPTPSHAPGPRPVLLHQVHHVEVSPGSLQRNYHHLSVENIQHLVRSMMSPFGLFLIAWFSSFAGTAAFFALYPILMKNAYGVAPGISSIGFAVAAALGLVLYTPAGAWSERVGAQRVLVVALGVRLLAFLGLFGLSLAQGSSIGYLALLGFLFVVLAWSLLSVAGTTLTAQLSLMGEGEGMGLFNATTALAGVVGAAAGGWVAELWGYKLISVIGIIGVALGILSISLIRTDLTSHHQPNNKTEGTGTL